MPLVAFTQLPTFQRLKDDYHDVLTLDKATHQDIRELHIGLLNMMPDASLQATERQFMRLVGDCNQIVQIYVHLFTLPSIKRDSEAQTWVDNYYQSFSQIKEQGLDALIISGAAPETAELQQEVFWSELTSVIDWALENVTSTLCACLASHALMEYLYDIKRQPLKDKKWGVFQHRLSQIKHPLTRHMNTRFDVPHSRFNQVTAEQLKIAGLINLAWSEKAGVHLAVSHDGFRVVFFQGHPEYDANSLLKEYRREILAWFDFQRASYPPFPQNYFSDKAQKKLLDYQKNSELCRNAGEPLPLWPEKWLAQNVDNTWRDTSLTIFNNWLGVVYQLTNKDLKKTFMEGVDPDDPLASLK